MDDIKALVSELGDIKLLISSDAKYESLEISDRIQRIENRAVMIIDELNS